jgi:hypothetical protein
MTYGFRPENWPAFEHELRRRGIAVADIEKLEIRADESATVMVSRPGLEPGTP